MLQLHEAPGSPLTRHPAPGTQKWEHRSSAGSTQACLQVSPHLFVVLLRLLLHRVQQAHGGADLANLLERRNQCAVGGHLRPRLHAL